MNNGTEYILDFENITMKDLPRVGGKNASLGEMLHTLKPKGISVLDGFATTSMAYEKLLGESNLKERLRKIFADFDPENVDQLAERGHAARTAVLQTPIPQVLRAAILSAHERLCKRLAREPEFAVRSSATAEDLPEASFAGAAETFLNVKGPEALMGAIHSCYSSLFTDRAISYRARMGYDQMQVALSVGVMPMVRSDKASSGVIFTLDTETGFRDVIMITSSYGLGEFVVQGVVTPDEWTVFKPTLSQGYQPIIGRRLGSKEVRLVYGDSSRTTRSEPTPLAERNRFSLSDSEVLQLAQWAALIEKHYSRLAGRPQPMDIEWAKDGITGHLYIVQARPETVHSAKPRTAAAQVFHLKMKPGSPLVSGQAVGEKIGIGSVRIARQLTELSNVQTGDVLVAPSTNPDWEPVMRKVAAIVTDQGGRTAHAAIVSREFGLPCIVGTGNATVTLKDGKEVTVCCSEGAEGHVYEGSVPFEIETIDASMVPRTQTKILLTVGDPAQAFGFSLIPNSGVGLARSEFIINNHIGIHPMALAHYPNIKDTQAIQKIANRIGNEDPKEFFIRRFSEGISKIAAAFYPNPVIVRMSDFKTNEYAQLIAGREFEPEEENPMLGFRGASRYYDKRYAEGFALECASILRVRKEMGLNNVKIMIPFCRTVEEGKRVLKALEKNGLQQGNEGLEVYVMCELPSNVLLATDFLKIFDGFSIGSNDLTQLTLGLDRDSGTVAYLFDERNEAVLSLISSAVRAAKKAGKPIGICGQAPSDYPEFAEWLVLQGIDSISLNPDTAIKTALQIAKLEETLNREKQTAKEVPVS